MKGSCIIDGTDIYEAFGVFILKGGLNDLLCFPARREPQQNKWFESDSVDADLTEALFEEKKVNIDFYLKGNDPVNYLGRYENFFKFIAVPVYHTVYIRDLNASFELRYVNCPEFRQGKKLTHGGKVASDFRIEFSMDDPVTWLSRDSLPPVSRRHASSYFKLDGIDLSLYGIIVEKAYSSVFHYPKPKSGLVRKFRHLNGQWADTGIDRYRFEQKEITMECSMLTRSLDEFWNNFRYLFSILSKTNDYLELESLANGHVMKCYYKDMTNLKKVTPFRENNELICRFTLNLVCVDSRIPEIEFFLATEDGSFIETEDGFYIEL